VAGAVVLEGCRLLGRCLDVCEERAPQAQRARRPALQAQLYVAHNSVGAVDPVPSKPICSQMTYQQFNSDVR